MPESIALGVGGKLIAKSVNLTRPADTTPYTGGDVVSDSTSVASLRQFGPGIARSVGGSGVIVKARLDTDKTNDTSQYRLHLYTQNKIANIPLDNAADTAVFADIAVYLGFIDFPALGGAAGTNTTARALWTGGVGSTTAPAGPLAFVCDIADTSIYGKLVNMTGVTPASGQKFTLELTVLQN